MNQLRSISLVLLVFASMSSYGQADRWQQSIKYKMEIDFDTDKHQFDGKQYVQYENNSPDTLDRVFFHLYFNAFQPGSMMDERSRTISDPDPRVGDRISKLTPQEIGFHEIKLVKQNGMSTQYIVENTILEVTLAEPILPGSSTLFELEYHSQVPSQIRRSGRMNKEGIDYSMSQWYPKMAEYDYQGWHANPYVGREFHGVWGDFDVTINIDKKQILGATGTIQNPEVVGYGYQKGSKEPKKKGKTLSWHFKAKNVHDFVWAADPDYKHTSNKMHDGTVLHLLYQPGEKTDENWTQLPRAFDESLRWINDHYGKYPYPVYSVIQGGDGGMEYPMATLITGERKWSSLVGVTVHELMHSWYQMILGTNESLYPWMDEGFTSYASAQTMNHLRKQKIIPGKVVENPTLNSVRGYSNFALSGMEEPLTTHSDHYTTNRAYGLASYVKGSATLTQLDYIIGKEQLDQGLLDYYNTWKYKHPNVNDFIRIMERSSKIELDWFKEYWVQTTHVMDYSVDSIYNDKGGAIAVLKNRGTFPMPIDVEVTYTDGSTSRHNIALTLMRGNKVDKSFDGARIEQDWPWTHGTYLLKLDQAAARVSKIVIDPTKRMADVDLLNNVYPREPIIEKEEEEKDGK